MEQLNVSLSTSLSNTTDLQRLEEFQNHQVQIGLKDTNNIFFTEVKRAADANGIYVSSIHLPKLDPSKSEYYAQLLREIFGTNKYTLHPEKMQLSQVGLLWKPTLKRLKEKGIELGFENSRLSDSWLKNPYNIKDTPKELKMTLDFNHISKSLDEQKVLEDLEERIIIFHVAGRNNIGPYDHFDKFIPFMFASPRKEYVLEYGFEHKEPAKRDYRTLKKLFEEYQLSQNDSHQA